MGAPGRDLGGAARPRPVGRSGCVMPVAFPAIVCHTGARRAGRPVARAAHRVLVPEEVRLAENERKTALGEVLARIRTARTNLELEYDSTKATDLSTALSEAWESPVAESVEESISTGVTESAGAWDDLEVEVTRQYEGEPDEVEDDSVKARWYMSNLHPPGYYGYKNG